MSRKSFNKKSFGKAGFHNKKSGFIKTRDGDEDPYVNSSRTHHRRKNIKKFTDTFQRSTVNERSRPKCYGIRFLINNYNEMSLFKSLIKFLKLKKGIDFEYKVGTENSNYEALDYKKSDQNALHIDYTIDNMSKVKFEPVKAGDITVVGHIFYTANDIKIETYRLANVKGVYEHRSILHAIAETPRYPYMAITRWNANVNDEIEYSNMEHVDHYINYSDLSVPQDKFSLEQVFKTLIKDFNQEILNPKFKRL